jgi:septal ring factor EnvC (AmiA/AmiB activator)
MWHHPKYYEELRKKRKELEASLDPESEDQASSTKQRQAQATSIKPQASSVKRQATINNFQSP